MSYPNESDFIIVDDGYDRLDHGQFFFKDLKILLGLWYALLFIPLFLLLGPIGKA